MAKGSEKFESEKGILKRCGKDRAFYTRHPTEFSPKLAHALGAGVGEFPYDPKWTVFRTKISVRGKTAQSRPLLGWNPGKRVGKTNNKDFLEWPVGARQPAKAIGWEGRRHCDVTERPDGDVKPRENAPRRTVPYLLVWILFIFIKRSKRTRYWLKSNVFWLNFKRWYTFTAPH